MRLARLASSHRAKLAELLASVGEFRPDEVEVALELVDATLARPDAPDAYRFFVAEEAERVLGYVCYGPTPMTRGTFDLYWIATAPEARGRGVGKTLVDALFDELRAEGARLVRVETAGLDAYEATRKFYERTGFSCTARITGFYAPDDDLLIYTRYL